MANKQYKQYGMAPFSEHLPSQTSILRLSDFEKSFQCFYSFLKVSYAYDTQICNLINFNFLNSI